MSYTIQRHVTGHAYLLEMSKVLLLEKHLLRTGYLNRAMLRD